MFILIPFLIILLASIIIGVIVLKKLPYLQKLTPESHQMGDTLLHDFFPEVVGEYQKINFKEYKEIILRELEKFLRRIKLVLANVERWSEALIQKVRKVHRRTAIEAQKVEEKIAESVIGSIPDVTNIRPKKVTGMDDNELKLEEQRLIVEIAKNPKDPMLYETLGNVYIKLKNFQDAKESFKAAFKLDPYNEKIEKKLSNMTDKVSTEE